MPITFNSYGTCDGSNDPVIESIDTTGANYITVNGLAISASSGSAITIQNSTDIIISNSSISSLGAVALFADTSANVQVTGNQFS